MSNFKRIKNYNHTKIPHVLESGIRKACLNKKAVFLKPTTMQNHESIKEYLVSRKDKWNMVESSSEKQVDNSFLENPDIIEIQTQIVNNNLESINKNYFGNYLRKLRKSKGFTLRGVAAKLGMYPNVVSEMELKPGKFPNHDMARKLSEILNVNYNEFWLEVATGKNLFEFVNNLPENENTSPDEIEIYRKKLFSILKIA